MMAVSNLDLDPKSYPQLSAEEAAGLGIEIPQMPKFQLGPTTWNYLYYAIIVLSILIGVGALASTGDLATGILYFFFSLLGMAILGIVFLSSVVIPLCVKRYEQGVEAHKKALHAAQIALRERVEEERVKHEMFALNRTSTPAESSLDAAFLAQAEADFEPEVAHSSSAKAPVEDQASSLRRMVAAHQ